MQLIEKSKQVSLLYENDARDTLTLYFRNLMYAVEDEDNSGSADENISSKKSEVENASAVLRYFRHCGWISERELGRTGDNIATVMPYCRKMIDAIERIFNRDNSAALTNQIFAIYDVLHSAFTEGHGRNVRPYSNILTPVSDSVADLKNNLLMTMKNIDPEEKGEALQHISKCFMLESHKYVERRSIERRKKKEEKSKHKKCSGGTKYHDG